MKKKRKYEEVEIKEFEVVDTKEDTIAKKILNKYYDKLKVIKKSSF